MSILPAILLIGALLPIKAVQADGAAPVATGATVHGVPYFLQDQASSQAGNNILLQAYVLGFNPLQDGDPNSDYYFVDVQASATPASGWSVDTSGMNDAGGPSILVVATLLDCSGGGFVLAQIAPSTQPVYATGSSPITFSVSLALPGGANAAIATQFTPDSSQSGAVRTDQCLIQWNSGYCENVGNYCPEGASWHSAYSYQFEAVVQVAKNQPLSLNLTAQGNFWMCSTPVLCYPSQQDKSTTQIFQSFSMPPVTTVTSNPTGVGYVQVDDQAITTPSQFVWNVGDSHTLSAAEYVPGSPGVRYAFVGWSDGGTLSHIISAPSTTTTYVASYQEEDRLVISPSPNGSTNPPPSIQWYPMGQNVIVGAIPSAGYQLDNWVLDGESAGNASQIPLTLSSPHNLTAVFELEPTLSVTVGIGGQVTVTSQNINGGTPVILTSGLSRSFSVPTGTMVVLSAQPSPPYLFGNWTGNLSQQSETLTVVVKADLQETVSFKAVAATVSTTQSSSGLSTTTESLSSTGSTSQSTGTSSEGGNTNQGQSSTGSQPLVDWTTVVLVLGAGALIVVALAIIRIGKRS
jgi:hypothetical protein